MRKLLKQTCETKSEFGQLKKKNDVRLMPVAMVIRVNEWLPWDSAKGVILILCVGARARGDFWTVVVISHIKMNESGHRNVLKMKSRFF